LPDLTGTIVPSRPKPHVFYGWWIVVAGGILQFCGAGFFYYGLSTFFLPLTHEFGWSRALTSAAFSLHRLEGGVVAPLVGYAFDRLGPRKLATFGVTMLGLGYFVLSQANSFPAFAASVLIMSMGYSCGFTANTMATVANWFVRKRATALGYVFAGSGSGGLLVPLVALTVDSAGWRMAALVLGAATIIVGLPCALTLRHRPEDYSLLPDGDAQQPRRAPGVVGPVLKLPLTGTPRVEMNIPTREALHARSFWLLAAATSLVAVAQSALVVHAIPFLEGVGLPTAVAAGAISAMSVISIAGRIGFGYIGDRFQKRHMMALVLGLQGAGIIIFAGVTQVWHLIPFLVLFAPGYGGAYPIRPALQGELFGRRHFGTIQGFLLGCNAFAAMLGPIFAGWMFDVLGNYQLAFVLLGILALFSVPITLAMPRPAARPAGVA
jgi:MFS family permease